MRRRILVALVNDTPREQGEFETVAFIPDGAEREQISIALHHVHLPRLDEAGFIDWDEETGQVDCGEEFEKVRPLLEVMDEHRDEFPNDWP